MRSTLLLALCLEMVFAKVTKYTERLNLASKFDCDYNYKEFGKPVGGDCPEPTQTYWAAHGLPDIDDVVEEIYPYFVSFLILVVRSSQKNPVQNSRLLSG